MLASAAGAGFGENLKHIYFIWENVIEVFKKFFKKITNEKFSNS